MAFHALIIDDDVSFRKLLVLRLKTIDPDFAITEFGNLSDAKRHLQGNPQIQIDLVVLDQHLPDGRGTDFLAEGWFQDLAVLSMSSDPDPNIPGASLQAGATFFLNKSQLSEPLLIPLIRGVIDRNRIQGDLNRERVNKAVINTIRTLVATLRHEINNPLGAVLGAAYIMRVKSGSADDQQKAVELVETSGKRIKHVLEQLCEAVELEPVTKAAHEVFHIPGDKKWER